MICYNCNTNYPDQGPEPFFVCPACKKEHPSVLSRPFTELPAPKRTHRLSIVAVWNPIRPRKMRCEHATCKQKNIEEISECPVCGRWMCLPCFGYERVWVTIPLPTGTHPYPCAQCCNDNDGADPDAEKRAELWRWFREDIYE